MYFDPVMLPWSFFNELSSLFWNIFLFPPFISFLICWLQLCCIHFVVDLESVVQTFITGKVQITLYYLIKHCIIIMFLFLPSQRYAIVDINFTFLFYKSDIALLYFKLQIILLSCLSKNKFLVVDIELYLVSFSITRRISFSIPYLMGLLVMCFFCF